MVPSDPEPPDEIPSYIADGLDRQDPETLRAIATFAESLAAHTETAVEQELTEAAVDEDEPPGEYDEQEWEDLTAGVEAPGKATLTVKTINDNDYYYYQWRDGEEIKSEYVAPVSPG